MRILSGAPDQSIMRSKAGINRADKIEMPTSMDSASQFASSITLRVRELYEWSCA